MSVIFKIEGTVKVAETNVGLPGLFIKAYDKDLLFDDLLGSTISSSNGRFEIISESTDFREFFDLKPDIYFKTYNRPGEQLIYSTEDCVRWHSGRVETFDILIPREALGIEAPPEEVTLVDDRGQIRTDYDPGESLVVGFSRLASNTVHELTLLDEDGKRIFTNNLLSNVQGEIEPTILWPQFGLVDLASGEKLTLEQARERWKGRTLELQVSIQGKQVMQATIPIADQLERPLIMNTNQSGQVLNGFEVAQHDAVLSAYNVPFSGTARVYMVPRQHNWSSGDRFQPITLANGRPGFTDVEILEGENAFTQSIAAADELMPGAYDYIVRPMRYGYEDNEDFVLRESDLVTRC